MGRRREGWRGEEEESKRWTETGREYASGRDREKVQRVILTQSWSTCSTDCERLRMWEQARWRAGTDEDCPWVGGELYAWVCACVKCVHTCLSIFGREGLTWVSLQATCMWTDVSWGSGCCYVKWTEWEQAVWTLCVVVHVCVIVPKKSVVGKGESCHVMCLYPFIGMCVAKTSCLVLKTGSRDACWKPSLTLMSIFAWLGRNQKNLIKLQPVHACGNMCDRNNII